MPPILKVLIALAAALPGGEGRAVAAPIKQESFVRTEDHRVAAVGYRLVLAGVTLCSETAPLTGMQLHQLGDYAVGDRADAIKSYHLDRGPGVLTVLAESPAARAGLQAGDVLLSINGVPFQSPQEIASARDGTGKRDALEIVDESVDEALLRGATEFAVLRAGETFNVTLQSIPACPGRVRLARSSQPNAFADGRYVIITTRLLAFVRSDDELAVAMAHEFAHNILEHSTRLRAEKVPRGFLRHFGKNASRVWATEEEADRMGIKLYAAAGYDLAAVMPFWRRYYAHFDFVPQIFRTHPSLSAREKIFNEVAADVNTPAAPTP